MMDMLHTDKENMEMTLERVEDAMDLLNELMEINNIYERLKNTDAYGKVKGMNDFNKRNLVFQMLIDWFDKDEMLIAFDEWITALEVGLYEELSEMKKKYESKKE